MKRLLLSTTVVLSVFAASQVYAANGTVDANQLNFAPVTGKNLVTNNQVGTQTNQSSFTDGEINGSATAGGNDLSVNVGQGSTADVEGTQRNTGTTKALNFVKDNNGLEETTTVSTNNLEGYNYGVVPSGGLTAAALNGGQTVDGVVSSSFKNGSNTPKMVVAVDENGNEYVYTVPAKYWGTFPTPELAGKSNVTWYQADANGQPTGNKIGQSSYLASGEYQPNQNDVPVYETVEVTTVTPLREINVDVFSFGNNFVTTDSGQVTSDVNQVNNSLNLGLNFTKNNLVGKDINANATTTGNNTNLVGTEFDGNVDQKNTGLQASGNVVLNNDVGDDVDGVAMTFGNRQNVVVSEDANLNPKQRNSGLQVGANLYVGNTVGDNLNGDVVVYGNHLAAKGEHDVDMTVNQKNSGMQVGANVSLGNDVVDDVNFYSEVNGNSATVFAGDWNSHNSTNTVDGKQRNNGSVVSGNLVNSTTEVGNDVNLTAFARGNHGSFSSEDHVVVNNLRQRNNSKSVALNVVKGSNVGDDVDSVSAGFGNNLNIGSNNNDGGLGNLNSTTRQVNRGKVVGANVVKGVTVGDNVDVNAQAFGNSFVGTGNKNVITNIRQTNTGNVSARNKVVNSSVGGNLNAHSTAIGNTSTVNVGQ